jgi:type IV pilus assembly protein PilV
MKSRKKSLPRAVNYLQSRGTSLIEVLISVLILGIGLLGIASMQAITLRNGQSSMEQSQAVMQTYSILDAMRSNVLLARTNVYNTARTCVVPTATATLAQNDIRDWMTNLQTNIGPSACGTINCQANVCTITVDWDDSRATGGSVATPQQARTVSRI